MEVELRPFAAHYGEVMAIAVTDAQERFLGEPSVAAFLADDDDHPTFTSYAVCDGDTVVGFACYGQEVEHELWRRWIPLVVVDRRYQGQGYGRALMEAIIRRVRAESPGCRAIGLSCKPQNVVAMRLYRSLRFVEDQANDRGGIDMWLALDPE